MRIISDLTKDTRPTLKEILIEAINDIVEIDKNKDNEDIELIELENHTFYYRAVYLFMQRAILYYDNEDIEEWSKRELLKETKLPDVGTLADEARKQVDPFN